MRARLSGYTLAAVLGALALSGCGFQPLYSGAGFASLPGLQIETGGDRIDYAVRDAVRDYLGPGAARYRLTIDTEARTRPLGVSAAGDARRYGLVVTSAYALHDPVDGVLFEDVVSANVQYDSGSDPYERIAAEADAQERAATAVAERIVNGVAAGLRRREAGLEP